MPKTRDRTGRTILLELTDRSMAMLEAVRAYREHETGIKANKSDVLRLAISSLYDNLPDSFQIPRQES